MELWVFSVSETIAHFRVGNTHQQQLEIWLASIWFTESGVKIENKSPQITITTMAQFRYQNCILFIYAVPRIKYHFIFS